MIVIGNVAPNKPVPWYKKKRLGKKVVINQFLLERNRKYTKAQIEKERAYYRSLMIWPNDVMPQEFQPRSRGRPRKVVSDAKVEKGDNVGWGKVEQSDAPESRDLADIVEDEIIWRVVPIGEEDKILEEAKTLDSDIRYMYSDDRMWTFVRYQTEEEIARAKKIRRAEIVSFNAKIKAFNKAKRKEARKIWLKKMRVKNSMRAVMRRRWGYYRLPPKLRWHPLRWDPIPIKRSNTKTKLKGFKKVWRHVKKFEGIIHLEHEIFHPDRKVIKVNKIFENANFGDGYGYESLPPSEYGPIYSKLLEFACFFFKFSSYHDKLSKFILKTFPIRLDKNTMVLKSMYYFFMKEIIAFDTKLYFRLENIIGYGFQTKNIRNLIFFESIRKFNRFDKFNVDDLNLDKRNEEYISSDWFSLRFPLEYFMLFGNYVPYLRNLKYNEYSANYRNHFSTAAMNKRDHRIRKCLRIEQFKLIDQETADFYQLQERLLNNNFIPYSVSTPFNTLLDTKTIWTSWWNNDYDISIDTFKLSKKILLITSSLRHLWKTLSKFAKPFRYFLRLYNLSNLYKSWFITQSEYSPYPKTITYSLDHLYQMMRYMKFDWVNSNIFRFLQDRLKLIRKDLNWLKSDIFNLSTTSFNLSTIRGVSPKHKDLRVWDHFEPYTLFERNLAPFGERMDHEGQHRLRRFRFWNKKNWEKYKDRVEYDFPYRDQEIKPIQPDLKDRVEYDPDRDQEIKPIQPDLKDRVEYDLYREYDFPDRDQEIKPIQPDLKDRVEYDPYRDQEIKPIQPDLKDLLYYDFDFDLYEWRKKVNLLDYTPSLLLLAKTVTDQSIPNYYTDLSYMSRNDHRLFFQGFKYNIELIMWRIIKIYSSQHDYIMKLNALGNFVYNEVQAIVSATQYIYLDCISTARSQLEALGNPRVYHAFNFLNDFVIKFSSQWHVHYGNSNLRKKELVINHRYSKIVINRWYEYNYDWQFHLYLMECYGEYADFDYIAEYNDEEFDEKHGLKYHLRRFHERVASGEYDAKMNMLKARSLARKEAAYERKWNPPPPKVYPWELIRWGKDYTSEKKQAERLMQKYSAHPKVYRRTLRSYIAKLKRSAELAAIQKEGKKHLIYDSRIRLTKKDIERGLLIEDIQEKLNTFQELEQIIRKKSREINKEAKAKRKARERSLVKARANRALKRAEAKALNKEERARKRMLKKEEEIRMRAFKREEKARDRMLKKEEEIRMRELKKEERARDRVLEKEKRARDRVLEKEKRARDRVLEKEKRARDRVLEKEEKEL